jgi:hypothetical protein
MSIPDDVDADALISRLAGPLLPVDRIAFRRAAENALQQLPCAGEGLAYRIVREVWRGYFHPPPDQIAGHPPGQHQRPSKLIAAAAVGRDDPRVGRRGWADRRSRP